MRVRLRQTHDGRGAGEWITVGKDEAARLIRQGVAEIPRYRSTEKAVTRQSAKGQSA